MELNYKINNNNSVDEELTNIVKYIATHKEKAFSNIEQQSKKFKTPKKIKFLADNAKIMAEEWLDTNAISTIHNYKYSIWNINGTYVIVDNHSNAGTPKARMAEIYNKIYNKPVLTPPNEPVRDDLNITKAVIAAILFGLQLWSNPDRNYDNVSTTKDTPDDHMSIDNLAKTFLNNINQCYNNAINISNSIDLRTISANKNMETEMVGKKFSKILEDIDKLYKNVKDFTTIKNNLLFNNKPIPNKAAKYCIQKGFFNSLVQLVIELHNNYKRKSLTYYNGLEMCLAIIGFANLNDKGQEIEHAIQSNAFIVDNSASTRAKRYKFPHGFYMTAKRQRLLSNPGSFTYDELAKSAEFSSLMKRLDRINNFALTGRFFGSNSGNGFFFQ